MDVLKEEFKAMFAAFLPSELAVRFAQFLDMQPKRWAKIDPWTVWGETSSLITPWPKELMFSEVHKWPAMAAFAKRKVAVLRCGHDQPSLNNEALENIFLGKSHILEGFVSIERGTLGLAFNHSGGVRILSSRPLTPSSRGQPSAAAHVER